MYPKDRREYTEAFLVAYAQDPWKTKLIADFGQKYYDEVMRIHQERLNQDNYMIGPQSVAEWEQFREELKRS
jgi:hypothetical protein